jgi:Phycobilisome protein
MLSQIQSLSRRVDGRYATDAELQFLDNYAQSFSLRVETYRKLQAAETLIVKQVQAKMQEIDPTLFNPGKEDVSTKWKRDTIRTLRYSAIAMLLDDPNTLRERFLIWFQTIMRAFNAQQSCDITYLILQEVVKQHLPPMQANLFCPILELNRRLLGNTI